MPTPEPLTIGLLHPGEMGSAVGGCLAGRGHRVLWASRGRGPLTAARARAADLADAGSAAAIASQADIIISVCPPHAAQEVARSVAGFGGLYVDANAVAPRTAREVAGIAERGGARYVDGGIIGPPPAAPGTTRLYLSGPGAETIRDVFAGSPLDARIIDGHRWSASSVKLAYAAWTKGSAALLLACAALAEAEGVADVLRQEWDLSQPGLQARRHAAADAAAGLPPGFGLAAADIFRGYPRPRKG